MYPCVLDEGGDKLVHRQIPCEPDRFLDLIQPYRPDVLVGVE